MPVSYTVTRVTLPGGRFYFNDHNKSAAVVGWNFQSTRAVAYLPSWGSAFYLDDDSLNIIIVGIEFEDISSEWHPRSALGINNHGTIVGNLQMSNSEDLVTAPFLLTGTGSATPILQMLEPLDPNSHRESALRIKRQRRYGDFIDEDGQWR